MSLSHVLGDGWSYSALLRCWEEEFNDPDSSTPLMPLDYSRHALQDLPYNPPNYTDLQLDPMVSHMVVSRVPIASVATLQMKAHENLPRKRAISKNIALMAWMARLLGASEFV
eukprot:CAMPEP_0172910584 /NCGR_PEP_ID=MMETSP1075-20121228/184901_1 /TAXON_ID=2916 /ORGANISM="Ceratium fusus, Strain PA161109" /LENGTH=112 /DNA_ID=CAMNT_0013768747 /DNA_START=20 /DNA_END=355 /DNA_ORIENTATION=-